MYPTVSETKQIYHIIDHLKIEIEIFHNPYRFQLDQLFQMATRINKKRSFLFVSKVLGKHLAVPPQVPLLTASLLAMRYMEVVHGYKDSRAGAVVKAIQTHSNMENLLEDLEKNPIPLPKPATFIGFAETATALGHAFFGAFKENGTYIHTTREQIENLTSVINFEEEHSHATSHRVYASDSQLFDDDKEIILIDDEITTGKTAINIIRTLKEQFPNKGAFTVVSILDWRSDENRERFRQLEQELNITIHSVSLMDGRIQTIGEPLLEDEIQESIPSFEQMVDYLQIRSFMADSAYLKATSVNEDGTINHSPYLKGTGRFSIDHEYYYQSLQDYKKIADFVKQHRQGEKSLVLGTGEFMYIPMKIASYMGSGIQFHSTTRSPVYQLADKSYTIQNKFSFNCPENPGVKNHLYNIQPNQYDEIFIFIERMTSEDCLSSLLNDLKRTLIPKIKVVVMT